MRAQFHCYISNTNRAACRRRAVAGGGLPNMIFTNNFCHMGKLSMKLTPQLATMEPLMQAQFH